LHFIGHIILHHFLQKYNCFFIFYLTNKKTSGKPQKWVIFPEVVKNLLIAASRRHGDYKLQITNFPETSIPVPYQFNL